MTTEYQFPMEGTLWVHGKGALGGSAQRWFCVNSDEQFVAASWTACSGLVDGLAGRDCCVFLRSLRVVFSCIACDCCAWGLLRRIGLLT